MRDAFILLVACFWCYPKLLAQSPASIAGTVVNTVTGAPLSRVHVTLRADSPDDETRVYGAMSNDAGAFSMANVRPGVRYRLEPERAGFLFLPRVEQAPQGNIYLTLKPGEHITGYKLEMAPAVTVSGSVLDENGEPVAKVWVITRRVLPPVAINSLEPMLVRTDERGKFRLPRPPGKYHILAYPLNDPAEAREIRTDGTVDRRYIQTYYPSAATRESATAVELRAGADVNGIDIRLLASALLHLTGTVTDIPDGAKERRLVLEYGPSADTAIYHREVSFGADGKFSFDGLEPGFYRLYAHCAVGDAEWDSPERELTLSGSSAEFLQLPLVRGFEVTGRVEGIKQPEPPRVTLYPAPFNFRSGGSRTRFADMASDGTFRFKGVQAERYHVRVGSLADNGYMKTVRLGAAEAVGGMLDLRQGPSGAKLTITISAAGGQISGSLESRSGEVLRRQGLVYLFEDGQPPTLDHQYSGETTPEGTFEIKGLAPGKYRIYATVYGVTPNPVGSDYEALAKQRMAAAEMIEIHEGDRITRNVKVLGSK